MGFPLAAEIGTKHIIGNISYEWNGYAWDAVATAGAVAVTTYEYTATSGQTVFAAAGYRSKKYVDVYINGMKLSDTDFAASDETTVVLNVGATVGDLVVIEVSDAVIMADIIKTVGVTTLASGAAATVGYVDGALEFGMPVGPQGIQGIQGLKGDKGDTGATNVTNAVFTATASQTTFSTTYTVGNVWVYLNGVKLASTDYTATNGTSIVLATGATVGDVVEVVKFSELTFGADKQDLLVSGTNIKTINGTTLLGSGDISTPTYTLPNATDTIVGGVKVRLNGTTAYIRNDGTNA